ncbi:MAG TPA: hypothetical protein VGM80_12780 [Gaiellaceae bacterium]|jgi:hypothetical protein
MGIFRPERIVTGHDQREWEIYVSRFESPGWKPAESPAKGKLRPGSRLMRNVVWPAGRFVVLLPGALVRATSSTRVRIEAVTFYPWPESQAWSTTKEHLADVMFEVVRGLRIGEIARPDDADFHGSRQLVGGSFRIARPSD